jgi:hypothetical protein
MKLFITLSIAGMFLMLSSCNDTSHISTPTGGSNDKTTSTNDTGSAICTSSTYSNPFVDSNLKKMVLYDSVNDRYTVTDLSSIYSSIEGSTILKLCDGSLLFMAAAAGSGGDAKEIVKGNELLYRQYLDGTTESIDPSSLFVLNTVASFGFGSFNNASFLQVSLTKINIPYDVSFNDGSSEVVLIEYDTVTKEIKQVAILQSTPACSSQFTAEEKTELAATQATADAALAAYHACTANPPDAGCSDLCSANSAAQSALCTLKSALYSEYNCTGSPACAAGAACSKGASAGK